MHEFVCVRVCGCVSVIRSQTNLVYVSVVWVSRLTVSCELVWSWAVWPYLGWVCECMGAGVCVGCVLVCVCAACVCCLLVAALPCACDPLFRNFGARLPAFAIFALARPPGENAGWVVAEVAAQHIFTVLSFTFGRSTGPACGWPER